MKVKYHCFCKNLYEKSMDKMKEFEFPINKETEDTTHCNKWWSNYFVVQVGLNSVLLVIFIVNVFIEYIIRSVGKLTRPINE